MADERAPVQPPRFLATETGIRLMSAIVLGVVALGAAAMGGWTFALFWLLAGLATAYEWTTIAAVERRRALQAVIALALVGLATTHFVSVDAEAVVVLLGAAVALLLILSRHNRDRFWAVTGLGYAAVITVVPPIVRDHPRLGIVALLWMFAVVWATDVGAYFAGRAIGGPKLWPRVSPKKTWSGFFGGLAAGTLAGVAVVMIGRAAGVEPPVGLAGVVSLSIAASVIDQGGDLAESALKRHFDVKDTSHLIPGHGGVMDRIDGFWAVCLLVGLILAIAATAT
jgi:phosphatidate cytidylyltransferase